MSNETDLDWLARNVHAWSACATHVKQTLQGRIWANEPGLEEKSGWYTKQQWLARRAGLQNKPNWKGAPDWAEWLAQHESGFWCWGTGAASISTQEEGLGTWWSAKIGTPQWTGTSGEVLGDWRDTLEKRPEEFQPFTSIEDNQKKDMAQQQEMKQDNGWFERGELPPVGARVNVDGSGLVYGDGEKYCEVITHVEDTAVVRMSYGLGCFQSHVLSPSHTEREAAIEVMQSDISERWANCEELATHLVDKGWVKVGK